MLMELSPVNGENPSMMNNDVNLDMDHVNTFDYRGGKSIEVGQVHMSIKENEEHESNVTLRLRNKGGGGGGGGGGNGVERNKDLGEKNKREEFGTMFGVFMPCLQNILGVILFVRLPWIVAQAGMVYAVLVVLLCVSSTVLTALSMSALVTNGKVGAGGPYALLLHNMGPEVGCSVGILFYLGTAIGASMYTLGGVEALYTNFVSGGEGPVWEKMLISVGWTLALGGIVFAGMKYVAKVSMIFLIVVLGAIVFMTLGVILFAADAWDPAGILPREGSENVWSDFSEDPDTGQLPDITFIIALFYPSVTGIMAGCNRSSVLRSPGRSIPVGTLSAIGTTMTIYIVAILMFGFVVANETLKTNKLVASFIAWPHQYVVAVGIIMSTVGAGLQSLTGAPQLLRGIACDGHMPFLRYFATSSPSEEPRRAVVFTTCLSALVTLAGNLDYITPIITMFFLSMYASINLACFLSGVWRSPNFRPTWPYFHWGTALCGFLICFTLMFVISVLYAFIALFLVCFIFFYIRSSREKKEWGNALFGIRLDQAIGALLDISDISYQESRARRKKRVRRRKASSTNPSNSIVSFFGSKSPKGKGGGDDDFPDVAAALESDDSDSDIELEKLAKEFEDSMMDDESQMNSNWRPQILVLCKLEQYEKSFSKTRMRITQPTLLRLAAQLKKGRGLTIVNSIFPGDVLCEESRLSCLQGKKFLARELARNGVRGFSDVVLGSGPNLLEPLRVLLQTRGLGMLSPNTVMLSWPSRWRSSDGSQDHKDSYVLLLKDIIASRKAVLVVKDKVGFPCGEEDVCDGTIDVWWLLHDGDLLVLLPYLLQRHRAWSNTKLRIFAIVHSLIDVSRSQRKLQHHLEELRIKAEIIVINVGASHARDVDQNRTLYVHPTSTSAGEHKGGILSTNLFQSIGPEGAIDPPPAAAPPPTTTATAAAAAGTNVRPGSVPSSGSASTMTKSAPPASKRVRRSLSRHRKSSESDTPDPVKEAQHQQEVQQLAKTFAKVLQTSSGEDTQRWIKQKYSTNAGDTQKLGALFEELGSTTEEDSSSAAAATARDQDETALSQTSQITVSCCNLEDPFDPRNLASYQARMQILSHKENDTQRMDKRLRTARYLNSKILENSHEASLIILNLPLSRVTPGNEFIDYTETLTHGMKRVIMLRGHGSEFVSSLE